jgi:dipeptidyl aminopeptidase/acylaminoacyl peptidase
MRRLLLSTSVLTVVFACGGDPKPNPVAPVTSAKPLPSASVVSAPPAPPKEDAALTPRKTFFGNADRARVRISPDGKWLSFLASENGVMNVFVAPVADPTKAKAVTHEAKRNLRTYEWTMDGKHVLYTQDKDGDENFRIHSVDVSVPAGDDKELAGIDGVRAEIIAVSPKRKGEVVIGLNDRDKKFHDLYVADLKSGKRTLLQKNEDGFEGFVVDDDYKVRFALKPRSDGGTDVLEPQAAKPGDKSGKVSWANWTTIPMEDHLTTQIVDFDKAGTTVYMLDSRGRNTAALVTVDVKTKQPTVLVDDGQADLETLLVHPTEKKIQAAEAEYDHTRWHVIDKGLQADFDYLRGVTTGDLGIASRSLDDKTWIVAYNTEGPIKYYRYDRDKKTATALFVSHDAMAKITLGKTTSSFVKSRDGLDLPTYVTLPAAADPDGDGTPSAPLPTVLLVHGGPWARDSFGLAPQVQWLASRGYAVLQVNYRGSTGFGKNFVNAGNREWAGKMHDDLLDVVAWAKDKKIADPAKVAIMGGSYGGYATLVGLTFTPDAFTCGVDIVGPSNLITLLNTIPPYWAPAIEDFTKRIGDHRTDDGRKFLLSRSPLTKVDAIKRPLLIGQGANDPRVKQSESDQIVQAMQGKSIPVTYVLYPDEGHGFARAENKLSFNAVTEIFLAQCLGGGYQPIGDDFKGSTISVPAGKDRIFGLAAVLGTK